MNESEEKLSSQELKKAKIRERYKGINPEEIEVIPALPQIRLDDPDRMRELPYMPESPLMILTRPLPMNYRKTTIRML